MITFVRPITPPICVKFVKKKQVDMKTKNPNKVDRIVNLRIASYKINTFFRTAVHLKRNDCINTFQVGIYHLDLFFSRFSCGLFLLADMPVILLHKVNCCTNYVGFGINCSKFR